ncbi:hypothetical protein GobsT_00720 [Gemmata obscuriglobus]|uniref:Uncharacterized protein n=1 Tax=Gemmata obscuriglobus TaxID=114 RepID=A0A2Z3H5K7_9BACT|nr:hypothetical protein [Gemmata obscuriglobus]AWM41303.1 hypothetical protein C1280_32780 [Gemmata obscuriglobus]QEG25347.1 hypothetical protein GobsT_00720 [Gemmata obscuriglobus]VTR98303.1 unnamed protein product [Gemmata obscuriglobus UQM 2246]
MTPKPESHPLWAELRTNPDDTLKLALADYLEENGDPNTGYALRWCVAHDRWPRVTKSLIMWYTDPSEKHPGKKRDVARALLPVVLFAVLGQVQTRADLKFVGTGYAYSTLAIAMEVLGEVLADLRRMITTERARTDR